MRFCLPKAIALSYNFRVMVYTSCRQEQEEYDAGLQQSGQRISATREGFHLVVIQKYQQGFQCDAEYR